MLSLSSSLRSAAVLAACAFTLQAAVPTGWFFAGSKPQEYDCSLDPSTSYQNLPSTYIKSKPGVKTTGFGSMMQDFSAAQYAGKRLRFSAYLKSEDATSWGGLWMRVDDANHQRNGYPSMVAFDNMHDGLQDRSVKGTTGWQNYSIVLDVPEGATGIYIGFLLEGPGALWVSGMKLEVVGTDVPVTGRPVNAPSHDAPTNLGFEK
jgi:hypothetical protein